MAFSEAIHAEITPQRAVNFEKLIDDLDV